jgi:hypothetical protein
MVPPEQRGPERRRRWCSRTQGALAPWLACLATALLWSVAGWAWTVSTPVLDPELVVRWPFSWFLCARSTLCFFGLHLLVCFSLFSMDVLKMIKSQKLMEYVSVRPYLLSLVFCLYGFYIIVGGKM